ncbi:MAG: UDP-N-acetylmuramoyl-L-alanine--D-glutamate ligase [Rhodospirillaceae bacterium]|nr:UDP-N-acetylmuramoyl-L-alanine--D-glutamate ligase [Rhodospirillaceae bacterium]
MIPVTAFADRTVAVFGLGRSGLSAGRALLAGGSTVLAWDDDPAKCEAGRALGLSIAAPADWDWSSVEALVLSPGVPLDHPKPHPVVDLARAAGCEVLGDVELLARTMSDARYVGITGTNGKSTTTALISHLLDAGGFDVQVGGNLGTPVLDLEPLGSGGIYVLEMSSYQLDLLHELVFDVAVFLNVSPDHLDRHGGLDGYVAAKKRIFHGQTDGQSAVVGIDDPVSAGIRDTLVADGRRVVSISAKDAVAGGVYAEDGALVDALDGAAETICDLGTVRTLPGSHNHQNIAAAFATVRLLGMPAAAAVRALKKFAGLPHRLEQVAEIDGVRYVNDSKATNVEAASHALAAYDAIYWIAGGRAKGDSLAPLDPLLPHVRHAYLIGEAAPTFAKDLDGKVAVTLSGTLSAAVHAASAAAAEVREDEPVVLLSPACASFDQFANFEARGEAFKALVLMLPGRDRAYGPPSPDRYAGDAA